MWLKIIVYRIVNRYYSAAHQAVNVNAAVDTTTRRYWNYELKNNRSDECEYFA